MRQKRAKAYKKLMQLYCMSFGFRQPYQVLVDAEMCRAAIAQDIELVKQISVVLHGEMKPMITQCCIHELYLQGREMQPAVDLAKSFERRKCNHREVIPGDQCIESVVGDKNKHRYVVATQIQPLRAKLRQVPATPLIHINRSVLILEPPSDATLALKKQNEEKSLHAKPSDLASVPKTEGEAAVKKRKGPKGPNPLSVKKKKAEPAPQNVPILKPSTKRKQEDDEDGTHERADDSPNRKRRRRHKATATRSNEDGDVDNDTIKD